MPMEENGLIISYRVGRLRYDGLRQLLPLKLKALRRALGAERRRVTAQLPSPRPLWAFDAQKLSDSDTLDAVR